jgi:hypothetical protein
MAATKAELLRVLIGYLLAQYGKGFQLLSQGEKDKLENEVLGAVFHVAHHLTDEAPLRRHETPDKN